MLSKIGSADKIVSYSHKTWTIVTIQPPIKLKTFKIDKMLKCHCTKNIAN